MGRPIEIKKLGWAGAGYRILTSWRKSSKAPPKTLFDAWIPGLAPNHALRERLEAGVFGWSEFCSRYIKQLRSPFSQDLLKPIALLSLRRNVVLVCGCPDRLRCSSQVLARALEDCRKRRNFVLSPPLKRAAGGLAVFLVLWAGLGTSHAFSTQLQNFPKPPLPQGERDLGKFSQRSSVGTPNILFPEDLGPKKIDVSAYPPEYQKTYREIFTPVFRFLGGAARVINSPLVEMSPRQEAATRQRSPDLFLDPAIIQPSPDAWKRYVEKIRLRPPCCGACPVLNLGQAKALWKFLVYDSLVRKTGAHALEWARLRKSLVDRFNKGHPPIKSQK